MFDRAIKTAMCASAVFLNACEQTAADREKEVLQAVIQYFHQHDTPTASPEELAVIFVAVPQTQAPVAKDVIGHDFQDPPPRWMEALKTSGVALRPVSEATYAQPFYRRRGSNIRALVFCIRDLKVIDDKRVEVETSSAVGPLAGGVVRYTLIRDGRHWRVTNSEYGAVF